jgi:PIN domain nuclease of toxin-antitoxin system
VAAPVRNGEKWQRPAKLLLDTQAFLWWVEGAPALGRRARSEVSAGNSPSNSVSGSSDSPGASVALSPEQLTRNGFVLFGVEFRHVVRVADLPFHHRDPVDRVLVAQALQDALAIVSADRVFRKYGVTVVW